jgi:hypothetical protein
MMIYCIAYNVYYVKQSPFVDSGGPAALILGRTKNTERGGHRRTQNIPLAIPLQLVPLPATTTFLDVQRSLPLYGKQLR